MANKAVTLSLKKSVGRKFRLMAMAKYGSGKDSISKLLTDTVENLSSKQKMSEADFKLLELLDKGINGGGLIKYSRDELYRRG